MPEKVILKRAAITSLALLVLSSINPTGYIFGDSTFAAEASSYLSQEDIEYNNLAQLISTDEGFLVKNMPQQQDSVIVERLDFVDHEVQKNESLENIAKMYNITPETIIWENNIVNVDSVTTGQRLRIPPTNGISHEVKRGDTLSGLVVKYDADSAKITRYNQLDKKGLKVGASIFIPDGKRITTQLIADNTAPTTNDKPAEKPTKVASIQTDINANIMPDNTGYEAPPKRPSVPDARPNPNVAPIQGVKSSTSISKDADPSIRTNVNITTDTKNKPIPDVAAPVTTGIWGKPTMGNITQGYNRGHYALDIANRSRPVVWATADGVVETAGWGGAYGNYVIIDHQNGFKTLYAHNSDLYVKTGDAVTKGQVISQMGNTGRVYGATGIHLHYECHQDGQRINPYSCME